MFYSVSMFSTYNLSVYSNDFVCAHELYHINVYSVYVRVCVCVCAHVCGCGCGVEESVGSECKLLSNVSLSHNA